MTEADLKDRSASDALALNPTIVLFMPKAESLAKLEVLTLSQNGCTIAEADLKDRSRLMLTISLSISFVNLVRSAARLPFLLHFDDLLSFQSTSHNFDWQHPSILHVKTMCYSCERQLVWRLGSYIMLESMNTWSVMS